MSNSENEAVVSVGAPEQQTVATPGTPRITDDQFRFLCDRSLEAMVLTNDNGRYVYVNLVACELFGYSQEQMLQMRFTDLVVPESANPSDNHQAYLQTGRESGEFQFIRADGEIRTAFYSAYRLVSGHHLRILRDITEARRAEQKLRESEQERAYVMSAARCLIWYADIIESDHPDLLFWNSRFVDLEGAQQFLPLEMETGETYDSARRRARLPADREVCDRVGTAAIRAGLSYEQEFRCTAANGEIHWLHEDVQVETVVEGRRWRAVGVCTDITARKQALEALRESEEKHRALFTTMTQGVVYQNAEGILIDANPTAERLLGITLDQMRGKTVRGPHWRAVREDGSDLPDAEHPAMVALRTGQIVQNFVMGIHNPAVESRRWLLVDAIPQFRPEEDTPYQVYSLFNDITERRQHLTEIETLNARLKQSIQETHHRVQNNLQIVAALVEIQMAEGDDVVPSTALARIGQHSRSLAAIHDLLIQDSETGIEANRLSSQAVVGQLFLLLRDTMRGRRLRYEVEDFQLSIQASASLALLVSELISNAARHSKTEIALTLALKENVAHLDVYDDGPGFPPEFDWRTAAKTGLGLVDSTGRYELRGDIAYDNRPGGGARVTVTFPVSAVPSA
jgi:PAS domain S-box-containing protein